MENNRGLGKGLGALISLFDEEPQEMQDREPRSASGPGVIPGGAQEIDIASIDNNLNQPRKTFVPEKLQELEESIRANGVIQPILVNRVGSRYMIVAGERRWRAAKNIGLKTIPAIVRNYSAKQIAEVALVENLMRSDLNEIEIAVGIKKLMDTHMMTQEQVSRVLGLSRPAIANSLRFLNMPKEVQMLLEHGRISAGHAKCLAGVSDAGLCVALANKCASGMTVRELESAIMGKKPTVAQKPQSLELKQFAVTLTRDFSTKVVVQGNESHGKIIIEYHTKKDLERIAGKLKIGGASGELKF
ncbi:MAG: ParB/RepB/Spo0J family partition protein [Christensenellaceae bacterium]|jgi:ParB family chromosome partitioning protein|nr:ParB/RepB/Spo0J family partition protein [Christensenellaceae bacterium]